MIGQIQIVYLKLQIIAQVEEFSMLVSRLTLSGLTLLTTVMVNAYNSPASSPSGITAPTTETVATEVNEPALSVAPAPEHQTPT